MDIVVQLRSDLAASIRSASLRTAAMTHAELQQLAATLSGLDADLRPQHPDVMDAALQSYFIVSCGQRDTPTCERIAATLRQNAAVKAAYLKADPELPH